jgi:hypothetical protein
MIRINIKSQNNKYLRRNGVHTSAEHICKNFSRVTRGPTSIEVGSLPSASWGFISVSIQSSQFSSTNLFQKPKQKRTPDGP